MWTSPCSAQSNPTFPQNIHLTIRTMSKMILRISAFPNLNLRNHTIFLPILEVNKFQKVSKILLNILMEILNHLKNTVKTFQHQKIFKTKLIQNHFILRKLISMLFNNQLMIQKSMLICENLLTLAFLVLLNNLTNPIQILGHFVIQT